MFLHDDYIDWAMQLGHPRNTAERSWDHALRTFPDQFRNVNENGKMELWICVSFGWQKIQPAENGWQQMQPLDGNHYAPYEQIAEYGGYEEVGKGGGA